MERLTEWRGEHAAIANHRENYIDRLAAYEDTGLEPEEAEACKVALMGKTLTEIKEIEGLSIERMKELAKAESEGRLLILPCKLGGIVYIIKEDYFNCEECTYKNEAHWNSKIAHCPLKIEEHVVKGFEVSGDSAGICISAPGEWGYEGLEHFSGYDGKWYRTREEAEAALRMEANDGN